MPPTLCEGWDARDLAAHLVLRERRPDAAAGVLVPVQVLTDHTQRVQEQYAEQPWDALVDMVREGPKGWSPIRVGSVDDAINLAEFYVHHEDVLRAEPGWTPQARRELDRDFAEALWARLRQVGQLFFRRSPVGLTLDAGGVGGRKQVKGETREGAVTLCGDPGEILLFRLRARLGGAGPHRGRAGRRRQVPRDPLRSLNRPPSRLSQLSLAATAAAAAPGCSGRDRAALVARRVRG
jgi:uncharacterized protein (TIGR03085 family)